MSDIEILSDEGGEIRSEDENDLEVVQEPTDEVIENAEPQEQDTEAAPDAQQQTPAVKRVRNPQPKLNADRLKGPRGIQTLEAVFDKIKFQGRGQEESDLNNLMRGYEYWCHRLFPKYTFDDCLKKLEVLGAKKEMQTHIKKIRMNLLFLDDINGTVRNDDEDETERVVTEEDPFDSLLPARSVDSNMPNDKVSSQTQSNELSEEQLERMRINREKAQRIRIQKMISRQNIPITQNGSNPSVNDQAASSSQLSMNENNLDIQEIMAHNQNEFDSIFNDLDFGEASDGFINAQNVTAQDNDNRPQTDSQVSNTDNLDTQEIETNDQNNVDEVSNFYSEHSSSQQDNMEVDQIIGTT